jgi:hypothetical protein
MNISRAILITVPIVAVVIGTGMLLAPVQPDLIERGLAIAVACLVVGGAWIALASHGIYIIPPFILFRGR